MKTCPMCRKGVETLSGSLPNGVEVCDECSQKVQDLLESTDSASIRKAFNYIYACAKDAPDAEMSDYLMTMLDANESAVEEIKEVEAVHQRKEKQGKPVDFEKAPDYFEDKNNSASNDGAAPAIYSVFAAQAWIIWILGFICAIIVAANIPQYKFAWFVGICVGALFAGCMPYALASVIKYLAQISHEATLIRKHITGKK